MLALKDKCLHPTTNTPYVKTAMGGKENSPEGIAVSFNSPALASLVQVSLVPASPVPNFLIEPFLVDPPFAEPLLPLLTVQVIFPEHDLSWLTVYTLRDRKVNA
jgi:hypothetical protein